MSISFEQSVNDVKRKSAWENIELLVSRTGLSSVSVPLSEPGYFSAGFNPALCSEKVCFECHRVYGVSELNLDVYS